MDARWCVVAMSVLVFVAGCTRERAPVEDASVVPVVPTFELPVCDVEEWRGIRPMPHEIARHRTFALPAVRYAVGEYPQEWGFRVSLLVDVEGRVQCYSGSRTLLGELMQANLQQRMALATLALSRYRPFVRDGEPVPALITEQMAGERRPLAHRTMPTVPLADVRMSLTLGGGYS